MTSVFISYQRKTSAMLAQLIAHRLTAAGVSAFLDTRDISAPGPFPAWLQREVENAEVFVCLLAAGTLDSAWVQAEIKTAYEHDKTLIPVFQESYSPPAPPHPEHVTALLQSQGVPVLDERNLYVEAALERLIKLVQAERIASTWPTASSKGSQRPPLKITYYRFWGTLLDAAKTHTSLHAGIKPARRNRIEATAGLPGCKFGYALHAQGGAQASVYLTLNQPDKAANKARFDRLAANRAGIEAAFGGPLDWARRDDITASTITYRFDIPDFHDDAHWPDIQDRMVNAMQRLEAALRPHLDALKT